MEPRKKNQITGFVSCDTHKGERVRYICSNNDCKSKLLYCGLCIN